MAIQYNDVLSPLRTAYNARAAWRNEKDRESWQLAELHTFRSRLAPGTRLLEIGAGPGHDSAYFQEEGLVVVATDLSEKMIEHCRAKGIEAYARDFLHLNFPPSSFDAVYAMKCLLHVPNHDLPAVLTAIRAILRPGGLLFIGTYSAPENTEGLRDDDDHVPPRFFSWRTDKQLLSFANGAQFDVADFHHVTTTLGYQLQSLTLRRPE
jgi:SAM-dependent methyltransferase